MVFMDLNTLVSFSQKLSILYLEDNKETAQATLDLLKNFFQKIDWAENGKVGLEKYQQKRYDLIFVDINMPIMNGIDFCKAVLEKDKKIFIIIISAYNDSKHYYQALQLGIHGYISKPIELKSFTAAIENVVEKIYHHYEYEEYRQQLENQLQQSSNTNELQDIQLHYKSYHDDLTGITNRYKLQEDLMVIDEGDFLLIDIDNFSHINSIYGSQLGDLLLIEFKEILQQIAIQHSYTLYRIGGDHFAMLRFIKDANKADKVASVISKYFTNNSVVLKDFNSFFELNISVTIGIALNNRGDKLMEMGIEALKYAQKNERTMTVYDEKLGVEQCYKDAFNAIAIVKKAILNNKLVPFFQPIEKNGHFAYECLARVIEDGKVLAPAMFLNDITHTALYTKLTQTMVTQSFEYFQNNACEFSINLCYKDIDNPKFLPWIKEKAIIYGVEKRLIIEIVESEYLNNFALVKDFMDSMRQIGVKFAIDDFGSGYSNFKYLLKLKPDFLKIDGSLIKDIDYNPQSVAIVKAISGFAKDLNIQTIAEFIHSKQVYEKAKALQIDYFQGYYIGEPKERLIDETPK